MIIYKYGIKKENDSWTTFSDLIDLNIRPDLTDFFMQFKYDKPVSLEFPDEQKVVFLFNNKELYEFFVQGWLVGINRDKYIKGEIR